ncbi:MAG: hypothetical protein L0I76_18360 [Pseudonocardia sp.]|nr:hypothetical protein [Pseudonocardia sp.]
MNARHRLTADRVVRPEATQGMPRVRRLPRLPRVARRTFLWLVPLVVLGLVLAALLGSSLVPFRPFTLDSYTVTPEKVCTGGAVRAEVTREFLQDFAYLKLTESWTTVDVAGYPPGRPIAGESAELPQAALKPTGGPETVPSPLLTQAPTTPGTYRVRIIAEYQGSRFGFLPAIGSDTFTSDNQVTVSACPDAPKGE